MEKSSVIIALASPNGTGALSIIRMSGKNCHFIVKGCLLEDKKFSSIDNNKIARYTFIKPNNKSFIDDITVIKYLAPYSYTGEDMVEIICHGSKLIVNSILKILKEQGMYSARRGEFTQRAFLNGKMDLIKAENIKSLIESKNEIQSKISENIHNEKYEKTLHSWINEIKKTLVFIETQIEFIEEVTTTIEDDIKLKEIICKIKKNVEQDIKLWNKIEKIQNGYKIVIAGPPNAGKSSLFNKILGYDRAIITNIPGTTRDTISETVFIENNEITIVDTAGIRQAENIIEKKGIDRSQNEIEEANVVIWVVGNDQIFVKPPKKIKSKTIVVINKIDIGTLKKCREDENSIKVSIEKNINIESIIEELKNRIKKISNCDIPEIISNSRHVQIAENINDYLKHVLVEWSEKEKAAFFLYKALEEFEEFFGRRDNEEIYNEIFDNFCIGK